MKAIILAAGVGKRLSEINQDERPKCLLSFAGRTLLQRHLQILEAAGVTDIYLVLGYQAHKVEEALDDWSQACLPKIIHNPDFRQGSSMSLWSARDVLLSGDDILLMDADVLYGSEMIQRLVSTAQENCFLLDRNFEPGPEPVKLCVKNGNLVEFRKQVDPSISYDLWGESVGFFRFSAQVSQMLAEQLDYYQRHARQDEPHEEAIRDLLLRDPELFGYEDVSGVPWIEIDFPDDVKRANTEILPLVE